MNLACVSHGFPCRILALVVMSIRRLAFRIPHNTTDWTLGVTSPIAGRTPEAAEFVRLSRAMYTGSGPFRGIARGIFAPSLCGGTR